MSSRPACDIHTNLQMEACWIETPNGGNSGFMCVVPGCMRQHDGRGYFWREDHGAGHTDAYRNRLQDARSAILKAISQR